MTTNPILVIAIFGMLANALSQPTITSHPRSQSVGQGANVTFSVTGSGVAPLSYQWRFAGADISGAMTNSLVLTNVESLHAGDDTAVVANASGSVTSRVAVLQVDRTFTKITTVNIATDSGKSTACAWDDYDNFGFPDLLVVNRGCCADAQWNFINHNNGDGTFRQPSDAEVGSIVSDMGEFHGAAWGDSCDGYLEVFVANYTLKAKLL
jgi:hypothetical protein